MTKMARQLAPLMMTARAAMDCGDGVHLCGVIVLESGYGGGNYHHTDTVVHGIWPQTGGYGTSACIAPSVSTTKPSSPLACYDDLSFQQHEWGKHGECAGVKDAADFFGQVCSLAAPPLAVMEDVKTSGGNLGAMQTAVANAGYPIYEVDSSNSQIYLSCCSGPDGQWKIADVSDFPSVCPWGDSPVPGPAPAPAPTPSPSPSPSPTYGRRRRAAPATTCVPRQHGPACSSNSDCEGVPDCVRCAGSGFCTTQPLTEMV